MVDYAVVSSEHLGHDGGVASSTSTSSFQVGVYQSPAWHCDLSVPRPDNFKFNSRIGTFISTRNLEIKI